MFVSPFACFAYFAVKNVFNSPSGCSALRFSLANARGHFYLRFMESQLEQYIPVVILGCVALGFAAGTLILSALVGKWANKNRHESRIKNTPYECGMLPVGEGQTRMSVKFYLVAMLFILFDIEVVFLYPWAVVYRKMLAANAGLIFGSMISFLAILFVGYIYALKKEAFNWKS